MDFRSTDMDNVMEDRLRVNKLVLKVASWVASAVARRVELPVDLAARVAVLAFGDELLDLELPRDSGLRWRQPGGRIFAAAYLLPRAEAALRQELIGRGARPQRCGLGSLDCVLLFLIPSTIPD